MYADSRKGNHGTKSAILYALYGVCPRASVSGDDCPEGKEGGKMAEHHTTAQQPVTRFAPDA